ncbi:MAG: hypothetical protein V3W09_04385 [Nitrososphaerales archaeon]
MRFPISDLVKRYAFLDPASGKTNQKVKRLRARSAIACIGLDYLWRIYVLYTWAARVSPSKIIEQTLWVNEEFHPTIFGVESNAQQYLFATQIEQAARAKGQHFPIAYVDQSSMVHKENRIRSVLEPVIFQGRLCTQESQIEAEGELSAFPTGRTVDIVDAIASAIALAPPMRIKRVLNSEAEELASILRKKGASPREIYQKTGLGAPV